MIYLQHAIGWVMDLFLDIANWIAKQFPPSYDPWDWDDPLDRQ